MYLVTVQTAFFSRSLPAADAREALQTLWMFAGQGFDLLVVDAHGCDVTLPQLEAMIARTAAASGSGGSLASELDRDLDCSLAFEQQAAAAPLL